ncbi:MAG: excinuclease ABC subunit UvrC [Coriobacteriia bacterium]|nr:excinuclease ABC subunit UvrC [Coriobacteriia bacterium]
MPKDNHVALLEQIKSVPLEPGVYLWKDSHGAVLYVGKAKLLRNRMRQYLTGQDEREKIPLMMERVTTFDYVVTSNEVESLILEVNLIGQFSPPYNVDFRDDKSFPFIAVTAGDVYPAIKYTREKRRSQTRYFGPYTDARAARETIDTVRRIIPFCRCTCAEWKRLTARGGEPIDRPCFDSHIGLGPGACTGAVTPEEYRANVDRVMRFLSGHHDDLEDELRESMQRASDNLDYEAAMRFRNRIRAIAAIRERQVMVADTSMNLDVVGFFREETIAGAYVLVVREGRVLYGNEFTLDKGMDIAQHELVSGFLTKYYSTASHVPQEIVIESELEDRDAIEEWFSTLRVAEGERATRVKLTVPTRGVKRELLDMASRNARHTLLRFMVRTRYTDQRVNAALLQLESALGLVAPPMRIECYDISTLHGTNSVGSMVVFSQGQKDLAAYRRFKIRRESDEANDVAMMKEVLSRRFSKIRREDKRFGVLPDVLIIDGGKPQLHATLSALEELGLSIPVAGLAKRDEEIWVEWSDAPILLPDGSASLYLVKQIRDEAHRFAIEYHRNLRGKAMTVSLLDEVVGLGDKRRKLLLKHFGSLKRLKAATLAQINEVHGIPADVASGVYAILHVEETCDAQE